MVIGPGTDIDRRIRRNVVEPQFQQHPFPGLRHTDIEIRSVDQSNAATAVGPFIVKSRIAFCPDVINGDLLGKDIIVIPAALNMPRLVMVLTRLEYKVGGRGDSENRWIRP